MSNLQQEQLPQSATKRSRRLKEKQCKNCNFTTDDKERLYEHIRDKHDPRMKPCPFEGCKFSSVSKSHMAYHIAAKHESKKEISCPWCNYKCLNKSMLNSHLKRHSDIHPYFCITCKASFKFANLLTKHTEINPFHEPGPVLRPDGSLYDPNDPRGKFENISRKRKFKKFENQIPSTSKESGTPDKPDSTKNECNKKKSPILSSQQHPVSQCQTRFVPILPATLISTNTPIFGNIRPLPSFHFSSNPSFFLSSPTFSAKRTLFDTSPHNNKCVTQSPSLPNMKLEPPQDQPMDLSCQKKENKKNKRKGRCFKIDVLNVLNDD